MFIEDCEVVHITKLIREYEHSLHSQGIFDTQGYVERYLQTLDFSGCRLDCTRYNPGNQKNRWVLICGGCDRFYFKLYRPYHSENPQFLCRKCLRLRYRSTQTSWRFDQRLKAKVKKLLKLESTLGSRRSRSHEIQDTIYDLKTSIINQVSSRKKVKKPDAG